jgi:hypothetical protein
MPEIQKDIDDLKNNFWGLGKDIKKIPDSPDRSRSPEFKSPKPN